MWPFKRKTLEAHLAGAKKIKINGVMFVIRKIDVVQHLTGLNVLQKIHEVYAVNREGKRPEVAADTTIEHLKKIKNYSRDIMLAGVVYPKLSAKEDGDGFFVEKLFADFELAQRLTEAILFHTYKKKLRIKSSTTGPG